MMIPVGSECIPRLQKTKNNWLRVVPSSEARNQRPNRPQGDGVQHSAGRDEENPGPRRPSNIKRSNATAHSIPKTARFTNPPTG